MPEITLLITIGGFVLATATFFIGRLTSTRTEGIEKGVMLTKLESIEKTVAKIEEKVETVNVDQINTKISSLEHRVKTLEDEYRGFLKRKTDVDRN